MEKLNYQFAASGAAAPLGSRVMVGVVGSGDLEVLIEPKAARDQIQIQISTSVDGMAHIWQALMERLFAASALPPMLIEMNDFGATPGVVRMRIEQALEELGVVI